MGGAVVLLVILAGVYGLHKLLLVLVLLRLFALGNLADVNGFVLELHASVPFGIDELHQRDILRKGLYGFLRDSESRIVLRTCEGGESFLLCLAGVNAALAVGVSAHR